MAQEANQQWNFRYLIYNGTRLETTISTLRDEMVDNKYIEYDEMDLGSLSTMSTKRNES